MLAGSMAYATASSHGEQLPFLSKLESLASSAVRTAGNTGADLIVVYTATGGCSLTPCAGHASSSWYCDSRLETHCRASEMLRVREQL
jgi:hypothetical protein